MTASSESSSTGSTAAVSDVESMHVVVHRGEGRMSWSEVPPPAIQAAAEIVVRVDVVTICGTDLHILSAIPTDGFVTHRFVVHEFVDAYDVFSRAGGTHALEVVLTR